MFRRQFASLVLATPLFAGCSTNSSSESSPTDSPTPDSGARASTSTTASPTETSSEDGLFGRPVPPATEDLETATRPPADEPPDATEATVSPEQYPRTPTEYDDESIKSFVESFERAYRRNALLDRWGGNVVSQGFFRDWTVTLATTENAGVGRCQYRFHYTERSEDGDIVADSATHVVTYYVDDTLVSRAEDTGHVEDRDELAPDPWETGTVLEPPE